jgi:hypothetical protein
MEMMTENFDREGEEKNALEVFRNLEKKWEKWSKFFLKKNLEFQKTIMPFKWKDIIILR